MSVRFCRFLVLTVIPLLLLAHSVRGEAGSDQHTRQRVAEARKCLETPSMLEHATNVFREPWPLVRAQAAFSSAFSNRLQAPQLVEPLLEDEHLLPFYAACRVLSEVASEDCLEGLARAEERLPSFHGRQADWLGLGMVLDRAYLKVTGKVSDKPGREQLSQWRARFRGMAVPWRLGVTEYHDLWGALVLPDSELIAGEPFRCLAYWSSGAPGGINPMADWARKGLPQPPTPGFPTAQEVSKGQPFISWCRLDNLFLPEETGIPRSASELKVVGSSTQAAGQPNFLYNAIALEGEKAPVLPGWYLAEFRFVRLETHTSGVSQVADALPLLVYVRAGEALEKEIAERVATLGAMEELSDEETTEHLERLRELRPAGVTEPLLKVLDYAKQRDEQRPPKKVSPRNLRLLCEVLALTGDPQVVKPLLSLEPFKELVYYMDSRGGRPGSALRLVGLPAVRELVLLLDEPSLPPEQRRVALASLLELDRALGIPRLLEELGKTDSLEHADRFVPLFPRGRELRRWAPSIADLCRLYGNRGAPWAWVTDRLVSLLAEADGEQVIGFLEASDSPEAKQKLAEVYLKAGKFDEVLALAEPAFRGSAQHWLFAQYQAEAAYRAEKFELAADLFRKCAESPQAGSGAVMAASYRRAQCLEKLGDAKGALSLLESLGPEEELSVAYNAAGVNVWSSMVKALAAELREKTDGELPLIWRAPGLRVLGPVEGDKVLGLTSTATAGEIQGDVAELDLKTGSMCTLFRAPVRERPYASVLCGDMLAYASDLGVILGVSMRTWDVRWRVPIALGVAGQLIAGPDLFLVWEESGKLTAIDATTGVMRWEKTAYSWTGSQRAFAHGDRVFYWGPGRQLHYLEASTGRQLGAFEVRDGQSEPLFLRERLCVVSRGRTVVCVSPEDGKEYWKTPIEGWGEYARLQASEDGLWLSQPGALLLLDLETGAVKQTIRPGADEAGRQDFPLFTADAERLVCVSFGPRREDPKLALFDPRTGEKLAQRALGYSLAGNTRPLLWQDLIIVADDGRTSAYRYPPREKP